MKYKVETSLRDGHLSETVLEADNIQRAVESLSEAHPDMGWTANIHNAPHGATGLKWRDDGKGTEKIVVISPA